MAPKALSVADQVTKLTKERDGTNVTLKWLEKLLNDHATTPIPEAKIDHYFRTLARVQTKVEVTFQELLVLVEPADLDPHSAEYTSMLDRVIELEYQFKVIQQNFPTASGPTRAVATISSEVRLPRLTLPTFEGNIENWTSFRDIFITTIHNNANLSDSQKLTYLKAQLKGEAERQIQSIVICDANYTIAWKQLEDRYQNNRQLLFALIKRLMFQQDLQVATASSLRHLVDVSRECTRSLEVLKQPVMQWDSILLVIIHQKLDSTSKELYEQSLKDSSIPKLQGLYDFIEQRSRALEAGESSKSNVQTKHSDKSHHNSQRAFAHHTNAQSTCKVCDESYHPIYKCTKFLGWSTQRRSEAIKKMRCCFNCLKEGHQIAECPSSKGCKTCSGNHNTLLHKTRQPDQVQAQKSKRDDNNSDKSQSTSSQSLVHYTSSSQSLNEFDTLLATASIKVSDKFGQQHLYRALIDPGANTNYITENCIQTLGISRRRCYISATGLGGEAVAKSHGTTALSICPHFNSPISFFLSRCLIVDKITGRLPTEPFDNSRWSHLQGLQLADPNYHIPQHVDFLLGAEFFFAVLESDKKSGPLNSPFAVHTSFGWMVGGGSRMSTNPQVHTTVVSTSIANQISPSTTAASDENLDTLLRKFWELEAEPTEAIPNVQDQEIENHFDSNFTRDPQGRFIVKLPFKNPRPPLGSSLKMAMVRLHYLERRLKARPECKSQYSEFMGDYEALGHMKEVPPVEVDHPSINYLPHQFVLKESSTTTKLRVVFDASAKTSNGSSLNDIMLVGPNIQDSLVNIIIRFRLQEIALTADIAKMYRQVRVTDSDADLQRILWREDPSLPIRHLRLQTLTQGTAPGSFLAQKSVKKTGELGAKSMPTAAKITERDFYMDDLISGEPTVQQAIATQKQLVELLKSGGFELRKWSSNSQAVLDSIPSELRETHFLFSLEIDSSIKTLGIFWNPKSDQFVFKVSQFNDDASSEPTQLKPLTKRTVLSEIAQLFDPMGWLAPVIITSKIFMQLIWRLMIGWDVELPIDFRAKWKEYKKDLEGLSKLVINRFYFNGTSIHCPSLNLPTFDSSIKFCLAGFSDASIKACSAAVYLCAYSKNDSSVSLITSKTRVAPVKTVSLPRLELNGALLLANLIPTVQSALRIPIHSITAWTDSTITLDWIQSSPSKWETFVANRVTKIQEKVKPERWGHVISEENPADCASRGIDVNSLANHTLWWNGAPWLKNKIPVPTRPSAKTNSTTEEKVVCLHVSLSKYNEDMLNQFSSLIKLTKVTAFIRRFIKNCRKKTSKQKSAVSVSTCLANFPITPQELTSALHHWIKIVQQQSFSQEIKAIKGKTRISTTSKIFSLCPFLDSADLLRVGGRLKHSDLPFDQKHPILLPAHSILTKMIIQAEHLNNFHAGPQLLLSLLQRRFWIMRGKDHVRYQIRKCVVCTRHKAKTQQQVMADLPSFRVRPIRPFVKVGVDFAGPFLTKPIMKRSKTTLKSYLSIFVCCATKAVHLEVVSSLTTEAFIAAFRRFVSRRGLPSDVFSDCGTNFVGADNEMKQMIKIFQSNSSNTKIADQMSKDGVSWHFNPPASPHFGGLWESGVKSVKFHLKRIIGSQKLTFEELSTCMTQIESILNSRPLTPISTDPDDLAALTPGHFLIGGPLVSVPDPNLDHIKLNQLSRWQLIQQMTQSFWKRWSNEYLTRLQQRPKWMSGNKNISVNDMVLIKEENLSPLHWRLGRVQAVHPGPDNVVRVVTVKTSIGTLKRPIVKLCLLPIDHQPVSSIDSSAHIDLINTK